MSIPEFVDKLSKTIKDIESERSKAALKLSLDSLALVKRRWINTGRDSQGKRYNYSDAKIPFWFFRGKETNRDNANAVQDLYDKYGFFASYKDWRVVNNLPVRFINFSFTNRMWTAIQPRIKIEEAGRTVVTVEALSDNENAKVKFSNHRINGDILELSDDERNLLTVLNRKRILGAFDKNGINL